MILIVDDNPAVCEALALLLSIHHYDTLSAASPQEALEVVAREDIRLVIQDMNFHADTTSGEDGQALFYQLRTVNPDLPIILMTAWTNLGMAVELVKAGAADYIGKPWEDGKLLVSIANLLEITELQQENRRLREKESVHDQMRSELEAQHDLCGTTFASPLMHRLVDMAIQVAPAEVPILITGPNGAGKEKIAEIVQANSRRAQGPFIRVNAGALPADLLEAELFGAEKGAFTGSDKRRIGRFEAADGGTLFLDEIGNLPLAGQHKLLRVLQSGEFERIGSSVTQRVDVRVITATNEDLDAAIAAGRFRQDLYYRLNVVELKVPPLSERREDILPLAERFIAALDTDKDYRLSTRATAALRRHNWPGNVRELYNSVQRACLLAKQPLLQAADFGLIDADPGDGGGDIRAGDLSFEYIQQVLDAHDGVVARAARQLGISRQALYRRLEKKT
ncbi:sigma-54-dependent Fis family transcriptional regulator [Exilibacterium tricleocarpae]|uniref:Sigma-54-dependent Fis family transcriptional regulator n=1 Tax=Exilibacterium tricleocarpae TaxID=2591008 RepID=A0A545SYX6_9GAMM|nr:sigma-54 dependent transcriptional regulator [Exilibacterium tricleocarpae]TQV70173.1 sigma-54-dependent Fis family transcriptional regulator [Exilibacterium tricleocarpae]